MGIGNTYNYAVTAYDAAGNESPAAVLSVSTFSYALSYGTNNRDQLTSIGSSWAGTLVSFTYNPDGQRATRVLANATTTTYGYDAVGRVNSINHQSSAPGVSIQLQTYGYDLRDRRIWTQRNNALGDTYAYQADSQLIDFKFNANNPGATPTTWASHTSYVYDAVGNRTSVAVDGTTTNYTPDHANQYAAITGMGTQYGDGRGNMTALGGWSYAYDADNRMIAATGPGVIASFAYDPIGRLVKRVINGAVEFLTYDDQDVILAVDASNALQKAVVWGARVDEIVTDYTPQRTNYFYHGDAQGNTIAVTDASGVVKESYLYDAFGTVNFFGPTGAQIGQSAIGAVYLFTGQEYMAPVGLYNYRNRFYSNLIGRFLQSDPKRLEPGDLNLYRYCSNDPFNRTDALGLESEKKGNAGESQGVDGEDAPNAGASGPMLLLAGTASTMTFSGAAAADGGGLAAIIGGGFTAVAEAAPPILMGGTAVIGTSIVFTTDVLPGLAPVTFGGIPRQVQQATAMGGTYTTPLPTRFDAKMQPSANAVGPHTTFKVDQTGRITNYQTWYPQTNPQNPNPWQAGTRVDITGKAHDGIPTPHVHDPASPKVRPANPNEMPRNP